MQVTMSAATIDSLEPLGYQSEILAYLKEMEPEVWAWASSLTVQEQHTREVRAQLLRDTYRLTVTSHPQAYELCQQAMERLRIQAPITLYQGNGTEMNASLVFLPGEVHVVFQGPILERLDGAELLALLGHELAHYRLWSEHGGDHLVTDRILHHSAASQGAGPGYAETARLYGLHTELYADRGAALAAQSSSAAISMLVKVQTGIAEVDADAYLQQALELDQKPDLVSEGISHPESFLRSQAVDMWWRQDAQADAWLKKRLCGSLQLTNLDLLGQITVNRMTLGLIARFLQDPDLRSERVISQVQQFFPDWPEECQPADALAPNDEPLHDSVQEYLHFVLLDLALADEDLRDQALLQAANMAAQMASLDGFQAVLKRDLKMGKRELANLEKRMKGSISA